MIAGTKYRGLFKYRKYEIKLIRESSSFLLITVILIMFGLLYVEATVLDQVQALINLGTAGGVIVAIKLFLGYIVKRDDQQSEVNERLSNTVTELSVSVGKLSDRVDSMGDSMDGLSHVIERSAERHSEALAETRGEVKNVRGDVNGVRERVREIQETGCQYAREAWRRERPGGHDEGRGP